MKIIAINPPSPDGKIYIRDINRSGRSSSELTIWPQTSLAMILAMFPEHDVQLWDCIAERWNYDYVRRRLEENRPDWVILQTVTCTWLSDMSVAYLAKAVGAKVLLISPHFEGVGEQIPICVADAVLRYRDEEPEYAIRRIITGQPVESWDTFENLPPARQDLLPIRRYRLPIIGRNYTFVLDSRGCPWSCIFCRQTVTWKNKVRFRRPMGVIEEIEKFKLRNIAFHSDTFTLNHSHVRDICRLMPNGVRWICNSRVDTVDEKLLREMKRAGCWMICYGIESGDDEVLKLNKKGATVGQARQAVEWANRAGIAVWGYFMVGLLGDTEASIRRTTELAKSLRLDVCNFSIAAPYPGTEWYRIADSRGWFSFRGLGELDQDNRSIISQPGLSCRDVARLQKDSYRQWYLSHRGIRFFLKYYRPQYTAQFWRIIKSKWNSLKTTP